MRFVLAGSAALAGVLMWLPNLPVSAQAPALALAPLSSRADMVTGGNARVELRGAGSSTSGVRITVNGRDVSASFAADAARGSLVGVIDGLRVGENTIEARTAGRTARLTVTNHPLAGPVFSGPHLTPFVCRTEESGLGAPLDANCTAATKVEYFYRSTTPPAAPAGGRGAGSPYKPWPAPPEPRPTDIAQTTTSGGRIVPYIVRVESGTINRSIYRIAILDDPATAASQAWRPGQGWNGRLMFSFGGGCGTNYDQGENTATGALNDAALSRGFAFAISTQNVMGQHCNDALSGEALMMIKEHFIERYGVPAWTMGIGGSGGAIQQLLIGQNYPGLLDGTMPSLTFPDSFSIRSGVSDCRLLVTYSRNFPDALTDAQRQAVQGLSAGTCESWDRGLANVMVADYAQGCGIPAEMVYHPVNNPKGARCTLWDTNLPSFGRDPQTGFARRTIDNVGMQYGLKALNEGVITKAQFLDLNERIGGFDNDGHVRAERSVADPEALRLAYATGRVNSGGGGLGSIPILHYRGYTDNRGDIHDRFRDLVVRERLRKAAGRTDNEVIWFHGGQAAISAQVTSDAIDTMSAWLDALIRDTSSAPAIEKVVRAKPDNAVDGCWDAQGTRINEVVSTGPKGRCNTLYPLHSSPRIAAGAPMTDDVLKCQLKPIAAGDYSVTFTADEMARLRRIFPSGVCDYSKPGVNQVPLAGTYLRLPLASQATRTSGQ
jgi:hypothetical protein